MNETESQSESVSRRYSIVSEKKNPPNNSGVATQVNQFEEGTEKLVEKIHQKFIWLKDTYLDRFESVRGSWSEKNQGKGDVTVICEPESLKMTF